MATDDATRMTPAAAVARHLEWLEYALAAARDEETRRRDRLGRATDRNRDKRTVRLSEVTAEVVELSALVQGLKDLQARPVTAARAVSRRGRPRKTGASAAKPRARRRTASTAAAAAPKAAASARPTAKSSAAKSSAAKSSAAKSGAAKSGAAKSGAAKSSAAKSSAAKPVGGSAGAKSTRAAKPKAAPPAKPATRRRARPSSPSA